MNENNAVKYIRNGSTVPSPRIPDHTRQLLQSLANPARRMKVIKVFGEVGKSAFALRLSHMLTAAGYSVGYISLTHAEAASREAIRHNGAPITGAAFTEAVNRTAEALQAPSLPALTPTAEELLLATGLVALEGLGCNLLILEGDSIPHSATAALEHPLLNVVTKTQDAEVARRICSLLDKSGGETVSANQTPSVARLLTERCAQVNCRLTTPIKSNFYQMEQTLGGIRFFYDKKEYVLASGALYETDTALTLIEAYRALARCGLRLTPPSLTAALHMGSEKGLFSIFSVSPTVLMDRATTGARLSALFETLSLHKELLGEDFEVWTAPAYQNAITDGFSAENAPRLRSLLVIDEKNPYKAIKLALRDRTGDLPLLVLGDCDFISYVDRTLKGFL